MKPLRIAFGHHLSLAYYGGGEKWLIELSKEFANRGHDVEIYALPFLLDGKPKIDPKEILCGIPYHEGFKHTIKADVTYITYHPLSHLTFRTSRPRIAGIHSHTYWLNPHPKYGILPNLANITNKFTSYFELRGFDAVHAVTKTYPINHPRVFYIPNFVDSQVYKPISPKSEDFTVAFASRKVWQKGWDVFKGIERFFDGKIKFSVSGGIPEDKMPEFFSNAHLTIVPSRVDTFGLTIVESMMCGTPVITSPISTHKNLDLPLIYSKTLRDYTKNIQSLEVKVEQNPQKYMELSDICQHNSQIYDKKVLINTLEKMFMDVAENA